MHSHAGVARLCRQGAHRPQDQHLRDHDLGDHFSLLIDAEYAKPAVRTQHNLYNLEKG